MNLIIILRRQLEDPNISTRNLVNFEVYPFLLLCFFINVMIPISALNCILHYLIITILLQMLNLRIIKSKENSFLIRIKLKNVALITKAHWQRMQTAYIEILEGPRIIWWMAALQTHILFMCYMTNIKT